MTVFGQQAAEACSGCAETNRKQARFCRKCGASLDGRDPFADFLGAEKDVTLLRGRLMTAVSLRARGLRPELNTLLLGRGSTGKSMLVDAFALAARRLGLVATAAVVREPASQVELASDTVAFFRAHAGRVVEVVDAQTLLLKRDEERRATHVLTRLYAALEAPELRGADSPIIFLSGSPGPMRAQLEVDERLRKTFGIQIELPDLSPESLCEIAVRLLNASGVGLAPEALERARARCAHLTSQSDYINAKSLHDDVLNRWLPAAVGRGSGASATWVTAQDIPEPVWTRRTPAEILSELDDLVGMATVRGWLSDLMTAEARKQERATALSRPYAYRGHVVLEGNPGTGKTTVVRHFARLFHAAGILPSERIVECSPSTLKGQFLGDTGKNMNDKLDAAIGGVLFLDEAHQLAGDPGLTRGADTYMREIAQVLVPRLENDATRLVVVFAGYPRKVEDALRTLDEGLPGRIAHRLTLPDYDAPQLVEIFTRLASREQVELAAEARPRLEAVCQLVCQRGGEDFANARSARTLFEHSERAMLSRPSSDLRTILPEDIPDNTSGAQFESRESVYASAMTELDELVGLDSIKRTIRTLAISAPIGRERREGGIGGKLSPDHWLFVGNPGVGKTEVARLMGRLLYGAGVLPTPNLVTKVGKALQNGPLGPTQEVEAAVRQAQGGLLFIDEAYGLRSADAIDILLTRLENDGSRFVAIAAGYPEDIAEWLTLNDGLERRFARRIEFPDYSHDELLEILGRRARGARYTLEVGTAEPLARLFREPALAELLPRRNAAMAGRVLKLMVEHSSARLGRMSQTERETAPINLLTRADIPEAHELL